MRVVRQFTRLLVIVIIAICMFIASTLFMHSSIKATDYQIFIRPTKQGVVEKRRCQVPLKLEEIRRAIKQTNTKEYVSTYFLLLDDINLKGYTYSQDEHIQNVEECLNRCKSQPICMAFVFITSDYICQYKKAEVGSAIIERSRLSGVRIEHKGYIIRELVKLEARYSRYISECEILNNNKRGNDSKIIVSLTTIPSRLNVQLGETIQSIVYGIFYPDVILIVIPNVSSRFHTIYGNVPDSVIAIDRQLIKVLRGDVDYGAATKLIPAITEYAKHVNDTVITIDDDNVYMPWLVGNLVSYSLKYPDHIITQTGYTLKPGKIRHPNFDYISQPSHPIQVDCLAGFTGVLYKKRFFHNGALLRTALFTEFKDGFYVDDDYISGVAGLLGTKVICIPQTPETGYAQVPGQATDENSLSSGVNKMNNIERQSRVLKSFKIKGAFSTRQALTY